MAVVKLRGQLRPAVEEVVAIDVVFDEERHPRGVQTNSEIGWDNRDMRAGLKRMFWLNDDELITGISITQHGIKATVIKKKAGP